MDQLELERLGIPTVTVVTTQFTELAKVVALSENALEMCFVTVPHPIGMISKADIEQKAVEAFPEVLRVATEWQPSAAKLPPTEHAYPEGRFQFTGTVGDVNKLFFERGWSLGIPIIPPTPDGIDEMLRGTNRNADEVLGQVPPRMATLTVELVAVHALMAGCKPEYMPLLIAALEGLLNPEVGWRGALATTATSEFVVIVNGPIINEIGLACKQGACGKGHHPNAAIGYAINLIAYVIGGSRPPSVDKSTLGSPADFVCWVFGENEDRLPRAWEPLHVERGFKKSDNVVTVMVSYPPVDNADHWSVTPQEHMRWWSCIVSPMLNVGEPCMMNVMELSPILAVGPEHAQLIASTGWTKADFRQALWEQTRISMDSFPDDCRNTTKLVKKLGPVTPETMIPITFKPDQFLIIVAGGDGKHSHYYPAFPGSFPVSKLVKK